MESPPLYEFGPFTAQPAERLLVRDQRAVSLTPKAFDLLMQLVERPGQLVGKQELMAALWPDTFVEEANLAYTMSALRKALGDGQSGEQYIQTVPTRGYRFVAPVTRREPASAASEGVAPTPTTVPRRVSVMLLATAAAVGVLAGLVVARWVPSRSAPSPAPVRVSAELGVDATLPLTDAPFALSADGTLLAFAARTGVGDPQLYVRRLDQLTATPLAGTERASIPFFSPDGRWLGFFADLKLKKVPVTGGAVVIPYRVVNHSFRPDKPRPWSKTAVLLRILAGQKDYALHPDGMRVLDPPSIPATTTATTTLRSMPPSHPAADGDRDREDRLGVER